jgi:predicted HTH domain antitoxin
MSATVAIDIPREILHAARISPAEVRRELAVLLFAQGRLSFGKARELAEMTHWQFQQLLASRAIPLHYDLDEYQQDLKTLRDAGRL